MDRDGWRCQEVLSSGERCLRTGWLEAHHVVALHAGGAPFDLHNVATLCREHHIRIHRRQLTPEESDWVAFVDAI